MKRIIIVFLVVQAAAIGMNAAPRTLREAEQEASQYFMHHMQTMRRAVKSNVLAHVWTGTQTNGDAALYVFNRGEEDGWIIISADDCAYTVLAYSDHGHWDASDMPVNAQAWLETYSGQIEQAVLESPNIRQAPANTQSYIPVQPLCSTLWGQGTPYNNLCPVDADGERSLTGCPATAASQIMRKHKYPTCGTGSHSYEWTDSKNQSHTLSVDFSQMNYDWERMISDYRALSSSDDQQAAVATLMYHCGVAAEMDYGSSNSGAISREMVGAMIEHFGYDKSVRVLAKDYMPEDSILRAVAADLSAGLPVYISAKTIKNEGHAFVCDGMDAEGLLSINWGWEGKSNGYYRLSAMNPKEQGAGGSKNNRGYTERVQLFTRIKPNAGGQYYYSMTADNIRVLNPACARNEQVKFRVDTLYNRGFASWEGNLKLLLYKNGQLFTTKTISSSQNPLKAGFYRSEISYNAVFSNMTSFPNGEYEVVIAARTDDQPDVTIPIHRKWLGEWRCKITLTDDSIHVTVPAINVPAPPEVANPAEYKFTQLSAYYYPSMSSENQHRWKLQLATAGFYSKEQSDDADQLLLLYRIYSHSAQSVLGNHTADKNDMYRCISATHYYGISADEENMVTTDANEGACALVYNQIGNSYTIRYRIRLYNKDYTGTVDIPLENIRAYYGEEYETHAKNERITLDHQQPEGIDEIRNDPSHAPRKVIRDGQILIIRGNTVYTMDGKRTRF